MAKSRARKIREKRAQEGRLNPEANRGTYALADLRTRMTKTKKDKMYHQKHKGRLSNHPYDHDNGLLYVSIHVSYFHPDEGQHYRCSMIMTEYLVIMKK